MPVSTILSMPRVRSISSRSVAQNEPLPGLSMIGSPGSGFSSAMISQPRLAAHEDAPARALVADAGADPLRAPALVGRQVGEVGPMALAGVDDVIALGAGRLEHARIGSIGARVSEMS